MDYSRETGLNVKKSYFKITRKRLSHRLNNVNIIWSDK